MSDCGEAKEPAPWGSSGETLFTITVPRGQILHGIDLTGRYLGLVTGGRRVQGGARYNDAAFFDTGEVAHVVLHDTATRVTEPMRRVKFAQPEDLLGVYVTMREDRLVVILITSHINARFGIPDILWRAVPFLSPPAPATTTADAPRTTPSAENVHSSGAAHPAEGRSGEHGSGRAMHSFAKDDNVVDAESLIRATIRLDTVLGRPGRRLDVTRDGSGAIYVRSVYNADSEAHALRRTIIERYCPGERPDDAPMEDSMAPRYTVVASVDQNGNPIWLGPCTARRALVRLHRNTNPTCSITLSGYSSRADAFASPITALESMATLSRAVRDYVSGRTVSSEELIHDAAPLSMVVYRCPIITAGEEHAPHLLRATHDGGITWCDEGVGQADLRTYCGGIMFPSGEFALAFEQCFMFGDDEMMFLRVARFTFGAPVHWRPATTAQQPPAFRAIVRTLLTLRNTPSECTLTTVGEFSSNPWSRLPWELMELIIDMLWRLTDRWRYRPADEM